MDEKFGNKKISFWKKIANTSIFEFFLAIWQYFATGNNFDLDGANN